MKKRFLAWFLSIFFVGCGWVYALVPSVSIEGYQGLAGNSVMDIIYDGRNIWVGTGSGLSKSNDDGRNWISYNKSNGLSENGISALAYFDSTLWVAESYDVFRGDRL